MPKQGILERLKHGPVLGDGGYLLELEKRGWVRPGPFTPEVAIVYPDALRELHIEFREAGAEVLQALTFYASRDKLATVGLEDRVDDINRSAVRVAKEVAGDQCLVAGNLSLTWMYEPNSPTAADTTHASKKCHRGPSRCNRIASHAELRRNVRGHTVCIEHIHDWKCCIPK